MTTPPGDAAPQTGQPSRAELVRLLGLILVFVLISVGLQLSGWNGPERLQQLVQSAGWAGVAVFVVGYALLVLLPTPASVLTILSGALFGLWLGALLAWTGAFLGAFGGFLIGRRLGRPAVDRLLQGRLQQADAMLTQHGLVAMLVVRLVPLFPYTALNYACGLLGVRTRDYLVGTALGIAPGVLAFAAVGASGADPAGIAVGVGGLIVLGVLGGTLGRRLLRRTDTSTATADR